MPENLPSSVSQNGPLSSQAPLSAARTTTAAGDACQSAAKYPHRAAHVATAWRQARAWIGVAYPRDLDSARAELRAKFPALAANVEHLRETAEAEALHYQCEPAATPELFQAALRVWEAAVLDALAGLATTKGGAHA
jgi:hypothetical protein